MPGAMDSSRVTVTGSVRDQTGAERLNSVIGYACALADADGNDRVLGKVAGLHDRTGALTVTWKVGPTADEMRYFTLAWGSSVGARSDDVRHETPDPVV